MSDEAFTTQNLYNPNQAIVLDDVREVEIPEDSPVLEHIDEFRDDHDFELAITTDEKSTCFAFSAEQLWELLEWAEAKLDDQLVYCDYHGTEHKAPLCDCHGEPKDLLGYDNGPHAAGHVWVCSVEEGER